MYQIDLNCDLGESYGKYTLGMDEQVLPYISSANIACGFHASDPVTMSHIVKQAKDHQVHIGAHPGFPDLMGFGRRNMNVTDEEAKAYVQYQIGALRGFCDANDVSISHVKPHGALYNMAAKDRRLSRAICEGIYSVDSNLVLLGLSGSQMIEAAKEVGLPYAREVFADREYEEDGTLVARSKAGALITDPEEAARRVIRMVKVKKVKAVNGKDIPIQADSVCIHGDGEQALLFVTMLHKRLLDSRIMVEAL